MITFNGVTKYYDDIVGVKDLDFAVEDGEFLVMLGPTGAGKTTTLNLTSGVIKPSAGEILFDNEVVNPISPRNRDVAFVFQDFILYPNMTVHDNIAFPFRSPIRNLAEEAIKKRTLQTAETLSIDRHLEKYPPNLSGGEQQRVGIARALVRDPEIFLMDEPLSNLDAKIKEELSSELKHLQEDRGDTFFYVTHDQALALSMADRLIVLQQGRIAQMGEPLSIYNNPQSVFVSKFLTQPEVNLFSCTLDGQNCQLREFSYSMELPATEQTLDSDRKYICGLLPKDLSIEFEGDHTGTRTKQTTNTLEGVVRQTRFLGSDQVITVQVSNSTLQVIAPPSADLSVGDSVQVTWNSKDAFLFDQKTDQRVL